MPGRGIPKAWPRECACGAMVARWLPSLTDRSAPPRGLCDPCDVKEGASVRFREERAALIAQERAAAIASGEAFWKARGIAVGQRVRVWGSGLFGRFAINGLACVDHRGAFVRAKYQGRTRSFEASSAEAA